MTSSIVVIFLTMASWAFAGKYEFIKPLERMPTDWTREEQPLGVSRAGEITHYDLSGYWREFVKDRKITFYLGLGYEAAFPGAAQVYLNLLKETSKEFKLDLVDFQFDPAKGQISFKDLRGIVYELTVGDELSAFQNAFAGHEVVMYHGHSRYGRGPAFRSFTNYFRMGDVFSTIEIEANNPYFGSEPFMHTAKYPVKTTEIGGKEYGYQYIGQKVESSYLPEKTYIKLIEGLDKDLRATQFLPGRQIFWLYSCSNIHYWRNSVRSMFPDPENKFVFGTVEEGMWGQSPAMAFFVNVIEQTKNSATIVKDLNDTHDCGNCFVAY